MKILVSQSNAQMTDKSETKFILKKKYTTIKSFTN